jgi:chromosome segregation ATPase
MNDSDRKEMVEIVKEAIQPLQQDIDALRTQVEQGFQSLVEAVIQPFMQMTERRFDQVDARLDRLEQRVTSLEQRVTNLERQFVRLNDEIADIKTLLKQHQADHPSREEVDALEARVTKLEAEVFSATD